MESPLTDWERTFEKENVPVGRASHSRGEIGVPPAPVGKRQSKSQDEPPISNLMKLFKFWMTRIRGFREERS